MMDIVDISIQVILVGLWLSLLVLLGSVFMNLVTT